MAKLTELDSKKIAFRAILENGTKLVFKTNAKNQEMGETCCSVVIGILLLEISV